jgi:hypothetical protein
MAMTSAAEAKLDSRIRPEISVLRSKTSYPKRSRAQAARRPDLTVLRGGAMPSGGAVPLVGPGPVGGDEATARAGAAAEGAAFLTRTAPPATGSDSGAARPVGRRPTAPEAPLRLTRRGKVVVGALVALAVAGVTALIWLAIAGQAEAAGPGMTGGGAGQGHTMMRVVVRPGETLWSIAVRTDPGADPRVVIQQIIDDNALRGAAIQQGQVLWVPRL